MERCCGKQLRPFKIKYILPHLKTADIKKKWTGCKYNKSQDKIKAFFRAVTGNILS